MRHQIIIKYRIVQFQCSMSLNSEEHWGKKKFDCCFDSHFILLISFTYQLNNLYQTFFLAYSVIPRNESFSKTYFLLFTTKLYTHRACISTTLFHLNFILIWKCPDANGHVCMNQVQWFTNWVRGSIWGFFYYYILYTIEDRTIR